MTLKRRLFTKEFKLQVVRAVEAGKSVAQAAREHQLHPHTILQWRKLHEQYAHHAFAGHGQTYRAEARKAFVGAPARAVDEGKRAAKKSLAAARSQAADGGGAEPRWRQEMSALVAAGEVPIAAACRALSLPRTSYYRATPQPEGEADVQLRDQIQQVALAWPSYGYRRITRELARLWVCA